MNADPIVPDDKDWTWVLERACPECELDVSAIDSSDVGEMIRSNAAAFADVLNGPTDVVRRRPEAATWSPLEYGAHVRDVYLLFAERLRLMLDEDDPLFANWDQDDTAIEQQYHLQDPATVATQLAAAGQALADAFDSIEDDQWRRTGRRSDGAEYTVDSFAKYLIHDPVHHLWDVSGETA